MLEKPKNSFGTVVHVNEHISIMGGVEVYLSQIQELLRERGWRSIWIGIRREGQVVSIESEDSDFQWVGRLCEFSSSYVGKMMQQGVIHVHSLSDPVLVRHLFSIAPVIRTMHEPRMFCPGHGKFWARSENPCSAPFGLHCLAHAYTQKCCNRHPKRLLPALANSIHERKSANAGRYHRIIANSRWMRDEAVATGFPEKLIEVLHYFTPERHAVHPSPVCEPRVVFVGRLSRTKGLHHLLRAFYQVKLSIPEARLDILGSGIDEAEFKQLAVKLDLGNSVFFHGWAARTQVDEFMSRASVVAFPSIYPEAFGISGIEAMMRGKPVVGYDVGGVSDWLHHGVTGSLVPASDTKGFAAALVDLLSNPQKAQVYGANARKVALEMFSPQAHFQKLITIYEAALVLRNNMK
jgi:glycosyltransferase involved in cell wall biosynthesis